MTAHPFTLAQRQHGFTLVEAVLVIVITGILSGMVALFIRLPVQGYIDSANRAQLTDAADLALRRMARDIRLALPNSIRLSPDSSSFEFLITKTGGRYRVADDPGAGDFLNFPDPTDATSVAAATADLTFDVIGTMPIDRQQILIGDSIVVYNMGPGQDPADAYIGGNRALVRVTPVSGSNTVTMDHNPFAAQNPVLASPSSRFQVITGPVTYYCNGGVGGTGTLTRYSGYPITAAQNGNATPTGTGLSSALVTRNVVSCKFDYDNLANTHSGLIGLTIVLQTPGSSDGPVTLMHQVHVDNTP